MVKRDLEKEKQLELAAIWGSEVDGDARYPKRRGGAKKPSALAPHPELPNDGDVPSDVDSERSNIEDEEDRAKKRPKKSAKKSTGEYRLHCFVESGTEKNAVRTVFEAYEPKVEIRTAQKGNLLNKSQFAVLTFRNKAMALHAVKTLDGTNQRDLLGVSKLRLNMMLNRQQSKMARKVLNQSLRKSRQVDFAAETKEDLDFVRKFISAHVGKK